MVEKKPVQVRDLTEIEIVSDPQVSPDGGRVAFVRTVLDYDKDEYLSDVWMADLEEGGARQFTSGRGKDKNPRWSPGGDSLLFTSTPPAREGEEKKPQLYVIPVGGGEARQVTDLKWGVESPRWSPDGRRILFISPVRKEEPEGDVRVIDRLEYRFNGKGFYEGKRKHLFTVPAKGGKLKQVTDGEFDVVSAEWLRGGGGVAFISNLDPEADKTREKYIYRVEAGGGEPLRLTDGPRAIGSLAPSMLEDVIAYIGHDFRRGLATNQDVWLVPSEGGESVNLTAGFDQDTGTKLSCDVRVSSPDPNPGWMPDGRSLMFTSTYGGVSKLYMVPSDGGPVEPILGGVDHSVEAWSVAEDGTIAYTALETARPIELWVWEKGESRRVTDLNRRYVARRDIRGHEGFGFESSAGHRVEGWVMTPPGFSEDRRYPMVVEIHGGPRGAYGHSMMHEFQVLAAQGWVVMYVNPWGSGGYEEDFQAGLPGHYGEQDYGDIMEAVDYVLKKYPYVDPDRLGVTGGSYGGFMTNWIVGHTDRFRAAVTQRSISNWYSFFGVSDIGWTFGKWEMDGTPWENEDRLMEKSPIRYVKNVKTPTLIIHSEEDYRCPMEQAEQWYTALKYLGVETELVRFPGENHDLSRSGKPKHREQRLNHIIRWFKKHLE